MHLLNFNKQLKRNEEISISYIANIPSGEYWIPPFKERQKLLKGNWNFICECEYCALQSGQIKKEKQKVMKKKERLFFYTRALCLRGVNKQYKI